MTEPVEHHSLSELYPLYQEYLDTFLIPAYRRHGAGLFGPPMSHAGYMATRRLLDALMENPYLDISGYPAEAIAGMNWVTTRAIEIVQNPDKNPDVEITLTYPTTFNRVKKLQLVMAATWDFSFRLNCHEIHPEPKMLQ